jgi:hypothetical protein
MYGNAIRRNKNNLIKMKEQVWAVCFHRLSTDQNSLHHFCSPLCPYKKAQTDNKLGAYKHTSNLPTVVMDIIKPIFRDLAHPDPLRKCLDGFTQNPNESANSLIWTYCPPKKYHGLTTVSTAVSIAVGVFNDGAKKTFLDIMRGLELSVGQFAADCFRQKNMRRIENVQRQANNASHEARVVQRRSRLARDEKQTLQEEFPYLSGGHYPSQTR